MRAQLVNKVERELEEHNFESANCFGMRSSFDAIARKGNFLLVLKILENIDGLTNQQAMDMLKLSHSTYAQPFLVGEKSNSFNLLDNVLYERHSVPAGSVQTFANILDEKTPEVKKFNTEKVRIDGKALADAREKQNISLKELSLRLKIAVSTLYRYEHQKIDASPENAKKLEQFFGEKLTKAFELEKPGEEFVNQDRIFSPLGFKTVVIVSSPFDIFAESKEKLIAGKDADPKTLKKRAALYPEISNILDSYSCFILKKTNEEQIGEIPVITRVELKELTTARELIKLLKEKL